MAGTWAWDSQRETRPDLSFLLTERKETPTYEPTPFDPNVKGDTSSLVDEYSPKYQRTPTEEEQSGGFFAGLGSGASLGFKGNVTNTGWAIQGLNDMAGGNADNLAGVAGEWLASVGRGDKLKVGEFQNIHSFQDFRQYIGEMIGQGVGSSAGIAAAGVAGFVASGGNPMGGLAAAGAAAFEQNYGEMLSTMHENPQIQQALKDGKVTRAQLATWSTTYGAVMGALDVAGIGEISKLTGVTKALTKDAKKAVAQEVADKLIPRVMKAGAAEGATEGVQQMVEEIGLARAGGDKSAYDQMMAVANSVVGGAIPGAVFGIPHIGGKKPAPPPAQLGGPGQSLALPPPQAPSGSSPNAPGGNPPPPPGKPAGDTGANTREDYRKSAGPRSPTDVPPSQQERVDQQFEILRRRQEEAGISPDLQVEDVELSQEEKDRVEGIFDRYRDRPADRKTRATSTELSEYDADLHLAAGAALPKPAAQLEAPLQEGAYAEAPGGLPAPPAQLPAPPAQPPAPAQDAAPEPFQRTPLPPERPPLPFTPLDRGREAPFGRTSGTIPNPLTPPAPAIEPVGPAPAPEPAPQQVPAAAPEIPARAPVEPTPPVVETPSLPQVTLAVPEEAPFQAVTPPSKPPVVERIRSLKGLAPLRRQMERAQEQAEAAAPPPRPTRTPLKKLHAEVTTAADVKAAAMRAVEWHPSKDVQRRAVEQAMAEARQKLPKFRRRMPKELVRRGIKVIERRANEIAEEIDREEKAQRARAGNVKHEEMLETQEAREKTAGITQKRKTTAEQPIHGESIRSQTSIDRLVLRAKDTIERLGDKAPQAAREIVRLFELRRPFLKTRSKKMTYSVMKAQEYTDLIKGQQLIWAREEDRQMEAYKQELAKKAAPPETAESIAAAEDEEAVSEKQQEAKQQRLLERTKGRNDLAKDSVDKHLGPDVFRTFSAKLIGPAMKRVVAEVEERLEKTGVKLSERVAPDKNAPWENFVVYSKRHLENTDGTEMNYHDRVVDVAIAYTILQSGNLREFNEFLRSETAREEQPSARAGSVEAIEQTRERKEQAKEGEHEPESGFEGFSERDFSKEQPAKLDPRATMEEQVDAATGFERKGHKFHKGDYTYQMRGDERIYSANEILGKTLFDSIRFVDKFLRKVDEAMEYALKHLVGDLKVYVLPDEVVSRLGVPDPNKPDPDIGGLYIPGSAYSASIGQRGYIILPKRLMLRENRHELRRVMMHEMIHAATLQAYFSDYKGSRQILDNLFKRAKQAAKAKGIDVDRTRPGNLAAYGWSSAEEFITEGLTNPRFQRILADLRMLPGDPDAVRLRDLKPGNFFPTAWGAFRAAVSRVLNTDIFGPKGMTYQDALMSAFEHTAQDAAGMRAAGALYEKVDPGNFYRPRGGIRMDEGLFPARTEPTQTRAEVADEIWGKENPAIMDTVRDVGQAIYEGVDASGRFSSLRALRDRFVTTTMGIRRRAEALGWGKTPFNDMIESFLKKDATRDKLRQAGMKVAAKLQRMMQSREFRDEVDKAQDIMDEATRANVDMRYDLNHPKNAWFRAGEGYLRHRLAHADLRRRYLALKPEVRAIVDEVGTTYGAMQRDAMKEAVKAILTAGRMQTALSSMRETVDSVAEWAVGGGMDRAGTGYATARDTRIAAHLTGTLAKKMNDALGVRAMQGFYIPLKRRGDYVITARRDYQNAKWLPKGALAIDENTFQFADAAAYEAYIRNNQRTKQDHILNVGHNKKKGTYTIKVQNRYMSMHENQTIADGERKRLIDGKQWDNVSVVEHARGGIEKNTQLLDAQTRAILEQLAKSGMSAAQLANAEAAIIQAQVQMMPGNRMEHHNRIARRNVHGASTREAVQAMRDYTFGYSNYVAGLRHNPEITAGLDWAKAYLRTNQNDPNHLKLSELVKEMEHRVKSIDGYTHRPMLHNLTTMTYVAQLLSVSNVFLQLIQTSTTWVEMAGRFGAIDATKYMMRAYRDIGVWDITKHSWKNVGTATFDIGRAFANRIPELNIDHAERIKNRLKGRDERAFQAMEDIGLIDANAGQELDVARAGQGYGTNVIGAVGSTVQALTSGIEAMNRSVTMLAATRLYMDKQGLSEAEAIRKALDMTEETQGLYAAANSPSVFNTSVGRLALQFKKFALFTGNWIARMIWGSFGGAKALATGQKMTEHQRVQLKTIGFTLLAIGALSGGQGAVPWEIFGLPLMLIQMLLGYKKPTDPAEWMQGKVGQLVNYMGASPADARKAAEILMHGLPRALNMDLSDRIGYQSLATFGQPKSFSAPDMGSWLWKSTAGPFGSKGLDTLSWIGSDKTWTSMPFLPKIVKDIDTAMTGMEEGTFTKYNRRALDPFDPWEGALKAGGFSTGREKRQWEPGGVRRLKSDEAELKAERGDLMGKWYKADLIKDADARDEAYEEIRQWNEGRPRSERIDRGDLYKLRQKRKSDERKERRKYGEEAYQ
jgi:hypothetical protein